jgi:exonuclease SbcD
MRILHTSDWHLGRSFHREDLLDAQGAYVDHLIEVVGSEGVDVVVVSGDVYDRALPPVDAVQLASEALRRLLAADVRVVITSGNHDSAPRLGFASDLIDAAGIHVRTDPSGVGTPVLIPDAHGDVAFHALPYLEPDLVRDSWGLSGRSHQATLDEAVRRVRLDLVSRASGTRAVVMAHAFVVGAAPSDSERDISVGGVASVSIETFSGFDYAALGHLHGRHTLSESVRYSGSPLAYSFGEATQRKGSWLVELGARGLTTAEFVDAPVPRRLALMRGELDQLLSDPVHRDVEDAWLQVTLTDPVRPMQAMDRLRRRFPHALVLRFEPASDPAGAAHNARPAVAGVSDRQVLTKFFETVRASPPTADELTLLDAASDACRIDEATAS